jgi:hypothetical protein
MHIFSCISVCATRHDGGPLTVARSSSSNILIGGRVISIIHLDNAISCVADDEGCPIRTMFELESMIMRGRAKSLSTAPRREGCGRSSESEITWYGSGGRCLCVFPIILRVACFGQVQTGKLCKLEYFFSFFPLNPPRSSRRTLSTWTVSPTLQTIYHQTP